MPHLKEDGVTQFCSPCEESARAKHTCGLSPDLKAKYIKEGYESCLREVKARVESLKKYTPQGGNMPDTYFSEGHNECLDEIKKLINEI